MVKEINQRGKRAYKCEECGLPYKDKNWAEKCEKWCKKHNSCNLKITRHSLK